MSIIITGLSNSRSLVVTRLLPEHNSILLVTANRLFVIRTNFDVRAMLHRFDYQILDINTRRIYSPCKWIKSLLEPILDNNFLDVWHVVADCKESVIAPGTEVHWNRINLDFFGLVVLVSQPHVENSNFTSMAPTFFWFWNFHGHFVVWSAVRRFSLCQQISCDWIRTVVSFFKDFTKAGSTVETKFDAVVSIFVASRAMALSEILVWIAHYWLIWAASVNTLDK